MQLRVAVSVALAAHATRARAEQDRPRERADREPAVEWDITGSGDSSIQGFATDISVDQGETVYFKIDTPSSELPDRHLPARLVRRARRAQDRDASSRRRPLPQIQPACLDRRIDRPDRLRQLGRVGVVGRARGRRLRASTSRSWCARTPARAASHVVFVVRDDDGGSKLLFQTSDTTWQAYNQYGGNSLYTGRHRPGRAYKVSYNRPFTTRAAPAPRTGVFNAEYPMVRWLERNGYDVSYSTGVDTDRRGARAARAPGVPVGRPRRVLVGGAARERRGGARRGREPRVLHRQRGVLEDALGAEHRRLGTPYRTLVTLQGDARRTRRSIPIAERGPAPGATRARSAPPADGGRPENALDRHDLHGQLLHRRHAGARGRRQAALLAQHQRRDARARADGDAGAEHARLRVGRGPRQRCRPAGADPALDDDVDAPSVHPGLRLDLRGRHRDAPSRRCTAHASGALVFGAGTVQWSWGLDATHDRGSARRSTPRMQQATVNLFADMGVQPGDAAGRARRRDRVDATRPRRPSTITAPADGATRRRAQRHRVRARRATSAAAWSAAVEVSIDGGATWHPADGRASLDLHVRRRPQPAPSRSAARAVDDSGNLERRAVRPVTVTVEPRRPARARSGTTYRPDRSPTDERHRSRSSSACKFRAEQRRLHHRPALLQGRGQHRHARRPPLDERRRRCSPRPPSPARPRRGWQQVTFATPVADRREHHLRRLVLTRRRATTRRPATSPRTAYANPPLHALADGDDGAQRRLPLRRQPAFPTEHVQRDQLLGRRRLHDHAAADLPVGSGRRRRVQCQRLRSRRRLPGRRQPAQADSDGDLVGDAWTTPRSPPTRTRRTRTGIWTAMRATTARPSPTRLRRTLDGMTSATPATTAPPSRNTNQADTDAGSASATRATTARPSPTRPRRFGRATASAMRATTA